MGPGEPSRDEVELSDRDRLLVAVAAETAAHLIAVGLVKVVDRQAVGPEGKCALAGLTAREHEVLKMIAAGHSNKTAGQSLGISPRTVEVHRAQVMAKLEARSTGHMIEIAAARGLLS